jgi:hypothetical protein
MRSSVSPGRARVLHRGRVQAAVVESRGSRVVQREERAAAREDQTAKQQRGVTLYSLSSW